jgi:hypothetical protein
MNSYSEAPVWRTLFYLRWRWAGLAAIWCAVVCLAATAGASTYYIDFAGGSDANDGLSTSTPFKTIPGTVKADASDYLNLLWGSFSAQARVPDNTTFIIKAGTTETFAAGGYVWLAASSGDFYQLGCTNLVFEVATNWGTGSTATIDATGMIVPIAIFLIQIDGVTVKGLTLQDSPLCGFELKEKAGSSAQDTNTVFDSCIINNCGTSLSGDLAGSGTACLQVRNAYNLTITNCIINGGANWICGIIIGDNHMHIVNGLITGCTISNLTGQFPLPESGLGIRCLNSQVTISNCVCTYSAKGFDLGENLGYGSNIIYKVISCTVSNNMYGVNFNNIGTTETYKSGLANFYLINCLIVSNSYTGSKNYAGPFNLYMVHNTFDNNGAGGEPYNGVNVVCNSDGANDTNQINFYCYNNIFRNPQDYQFLTAFYTTTNHISWHLDYNSYQQRASEPFVMWSLSYGPPQASFSYGVSGPGYSSGNWYSCYANATTNCSVGTGHYHNDANSTGTGCSNTNLPSLNADYTLQSSFPGSKLATNSWYIPEMGIDRYGQPRKHWDIGMYEYVTMQPPTFLHVSSASNGP